MPVERREQVTRIGIVRVNGKPEELDGRDGGQQPSMGGTSRVSREAQARICERLGVKFPGPTRPRGVIPRAYSPCDSQSRESGGGTGLDARGAGAAGVDSQREEDECPERPGGAIPVFMVDLRG